MANNVRYIRWLVENWPEQDRIAWAAAADPGGDFSDAGPAAKWSVRTRENVELAWGRYLEHTGRHWPLQLTTIIEDRIAIGKLRHYWQELQCTLAPVTVHSHFVFLSEAVRVMYPSCDRTVLLGVSNRLAVQARRSRDVEGRLIPPRELVSIGLAMMEEAETEKCQRKMAAVLYRDGCILLAGTLIPIRRGNWQRMVIGGHLMIEGDQMRIHIDPSETKGKREIDLTVPSTVAQRLQRYIDIYRPRFLRSDCEDKGQLWLSRSGKPMSGDVIGKKVKEVLKRRTGKAFSFHMFRHTCATFISETEPDKGHMATGALQHRNPRTTRIYIRGQQHKAFRLYQCDVKRIMGRLPRDL